jgi:hypothetical protein
MLQRICRRFERINAKYDTPWSRAGAIGAGAAGGRVNLALTMFWRAAAAFGRYWAIESEPPSAPTVRLSTMSPESIHALLTLAFGFAVAGMLGSFYQLVTAKPPSFQLLGARAQPSTVIALPFLMFTAPFIIMRNTIRGRQIEGQSFGFTTMATVVAGYWSLLSGTLVMKAIETLGLLIA